MLKPVATSATLCASGRAELRHDGFERVDDEPLRGTEMTVVGLSRAMLAETFRMTGAIAAHLVTDRDPLVAAYEHGKTARVTTIPKRAGGEHVSGRLLAYTSEELFIATAEPSAMTVVRRDSLAGYTIADPTVDDVLFAQGIYAHLTVERETPSVPAGLVVRYATSNLVASVEHSIRATDGMCETTLAVMNGTDVPYESVELVYVERPGDRRVNDITTRHRPRRGEELQALPEAEAPAMVVAAAQPPPPPPPQSSRARQRAAVPARIPVLRVGTTRVRMRAPVRLADFRVSFVATFDEVASDTDERCLAVREASWTMPEYAFMFSGAVEVDSAPGERYWLDAWCHPTAMWVTLDAPDDVLVRRRIHQQHLVGQARFRALVRVEVYNRSAVPAVVRVAQRVPPTNRPTVAKLFTFTGTAARGDEERHAAVEKSAFSPDAAVDPQMWSRPTLVSFETHLNRTTGEDEPSMSDLVLPSQAANSLVVFTYEIAT